MKLFIYCPKKPKQPAAQYFRSMAGHWFYDALFPSYRKVTHVSVKMEYQIYKLQFL